MTEWSKVTKAESAEQASRSPHDLAPVDAQVRTALMQARSSLTTRNVVGELLETLQIVGMRQKVQAMGSKVPPAPAPAPCF